MANGLQVDPSIGFHLGFGLAFICLQACAGLNPGGSNPTLQKTTVESRGDTATYRCLYHNRVARSEIILVSGIAEGALILRHPDGSKESETPYRAGKKWGEAVSYHQNGPRSGVSFYEADSLQINRSAEFDSLGRQISEWIPGGGNPLSGTYLIRDDGRITDSTRYVNGLKEGWSYSLDSEGDTVSKAYYASGIKDTVHRVWKQPSETYRTIESLLKVLRKKTPTLRHKYNEYLRLSRFKGKITVRLAILPDGTIGGIFPTGDTTGKPKFVRDILNVIQGWKFDPVKSKANDIVTIPFTFSE